MFKLPDGSLRLIVQGLTQLTLDEITETRPYLRARVTPAVESLDESDRLEIDALLRNIKTNFQQVVSLSPLLSDDLQTLAANITEPGRLSDFIASSLTTIATPVKQEVLETLDVRARMDALNRILIKELEVLELGSKIQSQVQSEVGKNQREYFLREQMKAIQKELGEGDDQTKEIEELDEKIEAAGMPEAVKKEAMRELDRLAKMPVAAAEYTVSRTYLDWLVTLPWQKRTEEVIDLPKTKGILDADHSGLEKAKDRILEYLAVRKLNPDVKGPILCFAGPPGVGKTSLAKSIAAVARTQVRARLARRHARRGRDSRPSAHLHRCPSRSDHSGHPARRVEEPGVHPRRDRQARLGLPRRSGVGAARGARSRAEQLVPRSLSRRAVRPVGGAVHHHRQRAGPGSAGAARSHGGARDPRLHRGGEAGDRARPSGAEADHQSRADAGADDDHRRGHPRRHPRLHARSRCPQSRARDWCAVPQGRAPAGGRRRSAADVTPIVVTEMLGAPTFMDEEMEERTKDPGVAIGLAWTPAGGDVLFIEASRMAGTGTLTLTGQLGDVMKESARAALSWFRAHAAAYGADPDFFKNAEIHLHVPSGAIPKDGPSAGVTIATALASELTKRPVRGDIAMTGEITLSGRVLPVGGIKEKVLAARRAGIRELILPRQNEKNVNEDLNEELRRELTIHYVQSVDEVLLLALTPVPTATKAPRRSQDRDVGLRSPRSTVKSAVRP